MARPHHHAVDGNPMTVEQPGRALPMPFSWWGAGLFIAVLLGGAGMALANLAAPWSWATVAVLIAVAVFVVVTGLRRGTWLDGTIIRQNGLLRARSLDLAAVDRLQLSVARVRSRQRVTLLAGPVRGGAILDLYVWNGYLRTGQPAWACRGLAAALTGCRAPGAADIVAQLLAQADHLDGGGAMADSPLAALARDPSERGH